MCTPRSVVQSPFRFPESVSSYPVPHTRLSRPAQAWAADRQEHRGTRQPPSPSPHHGKSLPVFFQRDILPHSSGQTVTVWERACAQGRVLWTGRDPGQQGSVTAPLLLRGAHRESARSGGCLPSLPPSLRPSHGHSRPGSVLLRPSSHSEEPAGVPSDTPGGSPRRAVAPAPLPPELTDEKVPVHPPLAGAQGPGKTRALHGVSICF